MEAWKPVLGYETMYDVSDLGRIRTVGRRVGRPEGLILKPGYNLRGYQQVELIGGKRHTVHLLVMQAFVGPKPEGMEINHKNGVKDDNRLENLEYVTKSQNKLHSVRVLGKGRGESHGMSKLTEDDVREIRRLHTTGLSQYELARRFKLTRPNIGFIVRRATWAHVSD